MGSGDFPKHESFSLQSESLLNKFIGTENIVALNGHVWKKHRMVGELTTKNLSTNPTLTFPPLDCKPRISSVNARQIIWEVV